MVRQPLLPLASAEPYRCYRTGVYPCSTVVAHSPLASVGAASAASAPIPRPPDDSTDPDAQTQTPPREERIDPCAHELLTILLSVPALADQRRPTAPTACNPAPIVLPITAACHMHTRTPLVRPTPERAAPPQPVNLYAGRWHVSGYDTGGAEILRFTAHVHTRIERPHPSAPAHAATHSHLRHAVRRALPDTIAQRQPPAPRAADEHQATLPAQHDTTQHLNTHTRHTHPPREPTVAQCTRTSVHDEQATASRRVDHHDVAANEPIGEPAIAAHCNAAAPAEGEQQEDMDRRRSLQSKLAATARGAWSALSSALGAGDTSPTAPTTGPDAEHPPHTPLAL